MWRVLCLETRRASRSLRVMGSAPPHNSSFLTAAEGPLLSPWPLVAVLLLLFALVLVLYSISLRFAWRRALSTAHRGKSRSTIWRLESPYVIRNISHGVISVLQRQYLVRSSRIWDCGRAPVRYVAICMVNVVICLRYEVLPRKHRYVQQRNHLE
jgi:hypothetical protein